MVDFREVTGAWFDIRGGSWKSAAYDFSRYSNLSDKPASGRSLAGAQGFDLERAAVIADALAQLCPGQPGQRLLFWSGFLDPQADHRGIPGMRGDDGVMAEDAVSGDFQGTAAVCFHRQVADRAAVSLDRLVIKSGAVFQADLSRIFQDEAFGKGDGLWGLRFDRAGGGWT